MKMLQFLPFIFLCILILGGCSSMLYLTAMHSSVALRGGDVTTFSNNNMFTGGGWVAALAVGFMGFCVITWILSSLLNSLSNLGGRERD